MKLYKKQFNISKNYIFILPTIAVSLDEPYYLDRNFAIEFHWLVFHARLLWLEGGVK